MKKEKMVLGDIIHQKRLLLKLTQQELAEKLYIPLKAVCEWETYQTNPDYSLLESLALILEIPLEELQKAYVEIEENTKLKSNNLKYYLGSSVFFLVAVFFLFSTFLAFDESNYTSENLNMQTIMIIFSSFFTLFFIYVTLFFIKKIKRKERKDFIGSYYYLLPQKEQKKVLKKYFFYMIPIITVNLILLIYYIISIIFKNQMLMKIGILLLCLTFSLLTSPLAKKIFARKMKISFFRK